MFRHAARWLLVLALAAYGAYTAWLAATASAWFALWAVPCIGGAIGVALLKPWARYFVYLVATCTALGWVAFVALGAASRWTYRGVMRTILALAPGLLLVALCVLAIVFVRGLYKDETAPADPPPGDPEETRP